MNITTDMAALINDFTPYNYYMTIKPMFFFILGMVIYSVFIFKFYRFFAKRDILKMKLQEYSDSFAGFIKGFFKFIFYIIENLIVIPILIFFWFAVLGALLIFLSKSTAPENILILTFALIAAIRITSYYNEELSRDLAKMIPFALLGVFIADSSYFSFESSMGVLKTVPTLLGSLLYYFSFVVLLEFILRSIFGIYHLFKDED